MYYFKEKIVMSHACTSDGSLELPNCRVVLAMGIMRVSTKLPSLAAGDGDEVNVPALLEQGRTAPPQVSTASPLREKVPKVRPAHPTAL